MSKVIDLTARAAPVRWYIEISDEGETIRCRYVDEGESLIRQQAHWRVVVEATAIDRLCIMLKEAEKQLAKEMAIMCSRNGRLAHSMTAVSNLDTIKGGRQHGSK